MKVTRSQAAYAAHQLRRMAADSREQPGGTSAAELFDASAERLEIKHQLVDRELFERRTGECLGR